MVKPKIKVKFKETGLEYKIKNKIQKIIKSHTTVGKCVTTEEWIVNVANCPVLPVYFAQTDIFNFFKIDLSIQ